MQGSFVAYVLVNADTKKYIGITSDISKRLAEHNEGKSEYTSFRGPWTLLWSSRVMSHTEALRLEKLMKKQKGGDGLQVLMRIFSQGS
ncbi:MAG: GIY-YIG nuclease family protein [Candidatus Peribacteraceae bacterium]|nr:GIY-YIG nuclease family protein [Candidatus Peribacteraceae bacterium]